MTRHERTGSDVFGGLEELFEGSRRQRQTVVEYCSCQQLVKQRRSDEGLAQHRRARRVQLSTVDLHHVAGDVSFVRHRRVTEDRAYRCAHCQRGGAAVEATYTAPRQYHRWLKLRYDFDDIRSTAIRLLIKCH